MGKLVEVQGSLFESEARALAHGCNAKGEMDSGIAVEFKKRYPQMFEEYRQRCLTESLTFTHFYVYENTPLIFNVITQYEPKNHAQMLGIMVGFKS